MQKRIFFGIGIFVIFLVAWGIYKATLPHRNAAGEQPIATISAIDLYSEFLHSENIADKKWVGKIIIVSGIISSVTQSGNYVSINLQAASDGGVNCSILKKDLDEEFKFKAGDSVNIKGKCTGFLMDVNLVDCVFNK
jgi:tRNA_anti-like